jgi:ADP-ribose pyrophosphatase YjhB (NUDIX family)
MEIKTQIENGGKTYKVIYQDGLPETPTDPKILDGVHSYCFYKDKLVVVSKDGQSWTPPGGGIEKKLGENFEEASIREIKEESNMKVLHQECMGYQDLERVEDGRIFRQFRMFAIVEPYGDFVSDPDGDIFHVKLIDPADYKEYIKWLEIGDHLMERALEMKREWEARQQPV